MAAPRADPPAIVEAGLFHQEFYEHQRSERFERPAEAFDDFLNRGLAAGLSPHPLFDVRFYLRSNPGVAAEGLNPVLHYLADGWREGRDPHPLFDGAWYIRQCGPTEANPLSHYLGHVGPKRVSPNPLFDDRFYLLEYPDVAEAGINPLEHYVRYGRSEGRLPAEALRTVTSAWSDRSSSLERGTYRRERTLWVWAGREQPGGDPGVALARLASLAARQARLEVRVMIDGPEAALGLGDDVKSVRLDDVGLIADADGYRPSALRMLLFALSQGLDHVEALPTAGAVDIAALFADLGVNVTVLPDSTLMQTAAPLPAAASKRVFVVCADWSLSGVHSVAEALGQALITRGWDFRLLFTRGTTGLLDRTTEGHGLPAVPYECLDTFACQTTRDHLAAIIRHLEWRAPCVMLTTFDDLANAVSPALTDRVGVVGWLQSDEDHYYESAYRLGRYWNALVGVSRHITETTVALNPSFAERTHLIANSTVSDQDRLPRTAATHVPDLRMVYVGRLAQYQKRILDVIPLVQQLERRGVGYQLTLVGSPATNEVDVRLRAALAGQLATGAVRLTGPLPRPLVLEELAAHNVFLLLSDFEGLPLSMVEAMACRCVPAVAAIPSGVPDLVTHGHNGLVFDHRDYGAWAEALRALALNPGRMAAMSQAARLTVLDRFTVESMASRFEEVFSTVLEQIDTGSWTRPQALSWRNPAGDVLLPPSMTGRRLD